MTDSNVRPECYARRGDALHHDDGTHKTTAPTTGGRALERHERAIRAHLAELQLNRSSADSGSAGVQEGR